MRRTTKAGSLEGSDGLENVLGNPDRGPAEGRPLKRMRLASGVNESDSPEHLAGRFHSSSGPAEYEVPYAILTHSHYLTHIGTSPIIRHVKTKSAKHTAQSAMSMLLDLILSDTPILHRRNHRRSALGRALGMCSASQQLPVERCWGGPRFVYTVDQTSSLSARVASFRTMRGQRWRHTLPPSMLVTRRP